MNLRCRPGDIAFIKRDDHPENLGAFVRVLEASPSDYGTGLHHWHVETTTEGRHLLVRMCNYGEPTGEVWPLLMADIPDAWLQPIRDPGDDATDEMVQRTGGSQQQAERDLMRDVEWAIAELERQKGAR